MAEAPGETEPRGAARRALARPGDQRRDSGEVIRVRRVTKAEHDRDDDDQQQVVPSEKDAIQSSSPNMSAHFRDGVDGHRETGGEDDEGARGGQEPDDGPRS